MDEDIQKEIDGLKQEIYRQKEQVHGIDELLKDRIDKDFPVDLWELSERELDNEMGNRLSFLNDDIDTRPDVHSISSHRRWLGKPIVWFKRLIMKITGFYTNSLLEKQRQFNAQTVMFHLAAFIRSRRNEREIKELEDKLKTLEEDYEFVCEELQRLKNERNRPGTD